MRLVVKMIFLFGMVNVFGMGWLIIYMWIGFVVCWFVSVCVNVFRLLRFVFLYFFRFLISVFIVVLLIWFFSGWGIWDVRGLVVCGINKYIDVIRRVVNRVSVVVNCVNWKIDVCWIKRCGWWFCNECMV